MTTSAGAKTGKKKTRRSRRTARPFWADHWPLGCPAYASRAYQDLPWPERVPYLAATDLVTVDSFPLPAGPPYGIEGWYEATFLVRPLTDCGACYVAALAWMALLQTLRRRTGPDGQPWEYARRPGVCRAELASLWNEAVALLGYEYEPSQ